MGEGLLSIGVEDCEFGDWIDRDVHDFVLSLDDSCLVPGNERAFSGPLWFEPSMEFKDTIGFNLAAMEHLKELMSMRSDAPFRDDKAKLMEMRMELSKHSDKLINGKRKKNKQKNMNFSQLKPSKARFGYFKPFPLLIVGVYCQKKRKGCLKHEFNQLKLMR